MVPAYLYLRSYPLVPGRKTQSSGNSGRGLLRQGSGTLRVSRLTLSSTFAGGKPGQQPDTDMQPAGWILYLWTQVMGWTREETMAYISHLRRQYRDPSVHGYCRVRVVYGRKPEVDAPRPAPITTTSSPSWRGCCTRVWRASCARVSRACCSCCCQ